MKYFFLDDDDSPYYIWNSEENPQMGYIERKDKANITAISQEVLEELWHHLYFSGNYSKESYPVISQTIDQKRYQMELIDPNQKKKGIFIKKITPRRNF